MNYTTDWSVEVNDAILQFIKTYQKYTEIKINFDAFLTANLHDLLSFIKQFLTEDNDFLLKTNVYQLHFLMENLEYYKKIFYTL